MTETLCETGETFHIKAGDLLPVIEELLRNSDGSPVVLGVGDTVRFHLVVPTLWIVTLNQPAEIVDGATGHVRYTWQPGDTEAMGTFKREWEVTYASGKPLTIPDDQLGYDVYIAPQGASGDPGVVDRGYGGY